MTRIFLPIIAILSFAVLVSARQYYYAPLGPWGLESTVIHAKSIRNKDAELHKVHTVSEKKNAKKAAKAAQKKQRKGSSSTADKENDSSAANQDARVDASPVVV